MMLKQRYADGAQHLQKRFGVVLETDRRTTDGFEAGDHSIGLRARRRSFAIDVMHPVEQATKAVGHPNKDQLLPVILEASGQALQQPCPKRVELLDARYVDDDAVCGPLERDSVDQLF